jgi:hypothetical protein
MLQLNPPLPVEVQSTNLPEGVQATTRRGWAYFLERFGIDSHLMWHVVMDETGEVVNVPNPDIRVDPNWSFGRKF